MMSFVVVVIGVIVVIFIADDTKLFGVAFIRTLSLCARSLAFSLCLVLAHTLSPLFLLVIVFVLCRLGQQRQGTQVVSPASPSRGGITASSNLSYHRNYNQQPRGRHADAAPQAAGPALPSSRGGNHSGNASGRAPPIPTLQSRTPALLPNNFKTEMCRNILPENGGYCPHGAGCIFAHSTKELRKRPVRDGQYAYPCPIMVSTGYW
jgi:hypothetical protein